MPKRLARRAWRQFQHSGSMNNLFTIVSIVGVFIIIYFVGQFFRDIDNSAEQVIYIDSPECNPAISSCRSVFDNGEIIFRFLQQPSALTPFDVEVQTRGFDAAKVSIAFSMNNMDMGLNVFSLDYQENKIWRVNAVLPVCSLARGDWIAELRVKYKDKVFRTDYAFE